MKEEIKAHNNVLELIGNTPLIKLNKITQNMKGNYFAKVEAFNPGHSTKDRIALYIIEEAEKKESLNQAIQSLKQLVETRVLAWQWLASLKVMIAFWRLAQNLLQIKLIC